MKVKKALCSLSAAFALQLGMLAASAQTNIYLFTGYETNITLPPGTYNITAYGAQGGSGNGSSGGLGAEMEGQFNFAGATTLTILVGGTGGTGSYGGGGGGGSFVANGSTPLVIAGGGGGGNASSGDLWVSGLIGTNAAGGGAGGVYGNGGGGGGSGGYGGGGGYAGYGGGAGAGFYGGGISGFYGGGGGGGFLSGGGGSGGGSSGSYGSPGGGGGGGYSGGGNGGFGGGGGGSEDGGGGAGGYSGGGGSGTSGYGGGGGGSIIDSSAITNLAEVSGIASPDGSPNGEIIIAVSAPPVPFTYTTNNGTITITGYTGTNTVVTIPSTINSLPVTSIGGLAFQRSSVTSVTFPDSVTSIGDSAFQVSSLTNVIIGNGVTNIGSAAFASSFGLATVTIPGSVSSIGENAFLDCNSLTNITVNVSNLFYSSLGGVLFDKAQTTLVQFPGGLGGSYTIPGSVTSIGIDAFSCPLTSVTVPDSVISIGDSAFASCVGLTNAIIGSGVTNIEEYAFAYCVRLTGIYFQGNAPAPSDAFYQDNTPGPTAYYLAGTTGWGPTFDGIPTLIILPPAPPLGISTYAGQPAVFFPTATGSNYVLQMTTNVSSGPWVTVTNGVPISGIIITNPPGNAFFRLH